MNLLPMNKAEAEKKHWIVRWLRYTGFIEVSAAVIIGLFYSFNLLTPLILQIVDIDPTLAAIIAMMLGGFVSFVAGLGITLPVWGLALVIDDLHALRIYAGGYVVLGDSPSPTSEYSR